MPRYALNFGLFCTLAKQMSREYFCPTEIKPFLTVTAELSPNLAVQKTVFVGGLIAQGSNTRKTQRTSWKSKLEPTAEQHVSR